MNSDFYGTRGGFISSKVVVAKGTGVGCGGGGGRKGGTGGAGVVTYELLRRMFDFCCLENFFGGSLCLIKFN